MATGEFLALKTILPPTTDVVSLGDSDISSDVFVSIHAQDLVSNSSYVPFNIENNFEVNIENDIVEERVRDSEFLTYIDELKLDKENRRKNKIAVFKRNSLIFFLLMSLVILIITGVTVVATLLFGHFDYELSQVVQVVNRSIVNHRRRSEETLEGLAYVIKILEKRMSEEEIRDMKASLSAFNNTLLEL